MRVAMKRLRTRLTRRGSISNCIIVLQLLSFLLSMIALALLHRSDLRGYLLGVVAVLLGIAALMLMLKEPELSARVVRTADAISA
jgi:hypothetical protein